MSRAQSPAFLVARSRAEWHALWEQIGQPPPAELPDHLMALGIFLGTRTSGGYGIDITDIRLERRAGHRERLAIFYREITPAPDAMVIQALTSPYMIVLVDRSDAAVRSVRVR